MTSQRATPRSLWSRPSRARLFATTRPAVRSRRPTDALLLVLCALALFGVVKTSSPPSGFWHGMADFATSLPGFFDVLWRAGLWLMSGWAVILVAAGLVCKRFDVVRDQILALGGSIVAVVIVEAALGGASRSLWDAAVAVGPPPDPVSVRVALAVAITVGASPSITRPFRAIGWWLIAAGALSVSVLAVAAPSGVVLGFLCGVSGAASVHLVFGSIGGQPSLAQVSKGLTDLGVQFGSLSEATAQEAGVYTATATDSAGCPLLVRVYGRDAWDAQLLANAWRALWFRGAAPPASSRLQQIEHEGFLTLLAARNDIPAQDVVRAGKTADNDAIIVIRVRGTPLAAEDGKLSPEAIDAIWDTVLALGAAGIAHGDLHAGAFRVDGSRAVIDSMASASVATNLDRRYIDLAQLLTLTAEALGTDKAVAIAQRRLAAADLAGVVPYVQKAALGPGLREVTGRRHFDVDDLRARIASEAGVEAPKMASIRRVSTRGLVEAALLVAAAYFLISTIAEVDINEVLDALRAASLPLLLLALVVGQLPRFAYGESTRAACPRPIPYGPPVLLQFSVTFVNLVFPSTVGRMALNIRFFQRQGIPPASAVSIGVIENFAGYTVQVFILLAAVVFGFGGIHVDLQRSSHDNGDLLDVLLLVLVLAIVAAIVAVATPRWRRRVVERARPALAQLRDTAANLRSPSRVARLLLANLAAEVLFACTLGLVLLALGSSLSLATLLVVNVFVSFFASMIPVPGGIGVTEGAFVVTLTAVGLDQSTAFAAAICYRLCTYYLPPIWGWFAFHRLEQTGLL